MACVHDARLGIGLAFNAWDATARARSPGRHAVWLAGALVLSLLRLEIAPHLQPRGAPAPSARLHRGHQRHRGHQHCLHPLPEAPSRPPAGHRGKRRKDHGENPSGSGSKLAFLATDEAWNVPPIGDSHPTGAVVVATTTFGRSDTPRDSLKRAWPTPSRYPWSCHGTGWLRVARSSVRVAAVANWRGPATCG